MRIPRSAGGKRVRCVIPGVWSVGIPGFQQGRRAEPSFQSRSGWIGDLPGTRTGKGNLGRARKGTWSRNAGKMGIPPSSSPEGNPEPTWAGLGWAGGTIPTFGAQGSFLKPGRIFPTTSCPTGMDRRDPTIPWASHGHPCIPKGIPWASQRASQRASLHPSQFQPGFLHGQAMGISPWMIQLQTSGQAAAPQGGRALPRDGQSGGIPAAARPCSRG